MGFSTEIITNNLVTRYHLLFQDDQPPPLEEAGYLEAEKGLPPPVSPPTELMLDDVEAVLRYLHSD